jgi:hypothetical protein
MTQPDTEIPVTRAECRLRHENVGQRFDTLERDMAAVKKDVSDMKGMLGTMADNQGLLLKVLVLVLVLVLAGRGLDVSSIVGGI